MPVSLLTLPYELREQVLTTLLSHKSSIRLQEPIERRSIFTSPIMQVCKPLREEAIWVFYQINSFIWVIDPEAVSPDGVALPGDAQVAPRGGYVTDPGLILSTTTQTGLQDPTECPPDSHQPTNNNNTHDEATTPLLSTLPWQNPTIFQDLRHLRLDLYLPEPYSRKVWQGAFATQLANFIHALDKGQRLREFKVLISSWHNFRGLGDWQAVVLLDGLGRMEVRGDAQVRGRGFDHELGSQMRKIGLGKSMRDGARAYRREVLGVSCGGLGGNLDWEWEGGVAI